VAETVAQQTIEVLHSSDVTVARRAATAMALAIGFDEKVAEEIVIAVSELASNLVRHAKCGTLTLTPLNEGGRIGIRIESQDSGPGIVDVEQAMTDGVSTAGSLGYGLGAVNRLMDEFAITSQQGAGGGTRIVCKRWVRGEASSVTPCPLAFGAATRAHPMMAVNGDAFVIKRWGTSALVAVIDGVGHGQFAQHAAQTGRQYIESHFDQPLQAIIGGVGRACRGTRGVVMAVARFDFRNPQSAIRLTFASVGNVEARVFGRPEPLNFIIRRGIVGVNAPDPVVTEHRWEPSNVMVLHSDGVTTHWRWEDFPNLVEASATVMAQRLLRALSKNDDDATVLVVKGRDDTL